MPRALLSIHIAGSGLFPSPRPPLTATGRRSPMGRFGKGMTGFFFGTKFGLALKYPSLYPDPLPFIVRRIYRMIHQEIHQDEID